MKKTMMLLSWALIFGLLTAPVGTGQAQDEPPLPVEEQPVEEQTAEVLAPDGVLATGYRRVSAGDSFTCAETTGGLARCWGLNNYGQIGDGTTVTHPIPTQVKGIINPKKVAAGLSHACALFGNGTVKCWGRNNRGQLGNGTNTDSLAPVQVSALSNASDISSSLNHTCVTTTDKHVKCWGWNGDGQLGDGTTENRNTPVTVSLNNVIGVSTGSYHTCGIITGGTLVCWGDNYYGQLGNGSTTDSLSPVNVNGSNDVVQVSAGKGHTCARLTSGAAKCWGWNAHGEVGDGTTTQRLTMTQVSGMTAGAAQIVAGNGFTCARMSNGSAMCWGDNIVGQLGNGSLVEGHIPGVVLGLSDVVDLALGDNHACAVLGNKQVYCWGGNVQGQLGNGQLGYATLPGAAVSGLTSPSTVRVGDNHVCTLKAGGGIQCWGKNIEGQLGDGTGRNKSTAVDVDGMGSSGVEIQTGSLHSCARSSGSPGGQAYCWGHNEYGQLGNGATADRLAPVKVSGLFNAVTFGLGGSFSCASIVGGGVKCWGANGSGQLGNGTETDSLVPVAVSGLSGIVTQLAAGSSHACVLIAGGVKCWGSNYQGALGNDSTVSSSTPVDVVGLGSGVTGITVGLWHACALLSNGSVKCWGDNDSGQVGDGTDDDRHIPTQVSGIGSGATAISAGMGHTCARMNDGSIRCWGSNILGQLGDGTVMQRNIPVTVQNISTALDVDAGGFTTCARINPGPDVICWGFNQDGQLGIDRFGYATKPVLIKDTYRYILLPIIKK